MRSRQWAWLWLAVSAVAGMVLASGCSTQTKRQWLTFFVDGIPPETTNTLAGTAGAVAGATNAIAALGTNLPPPMVMHPPFAEGKCVSCHENRYSTKMRGNLVDLCLACHKNLLVAGKSWHAPAASGDCVVCHESHQSSRKFLLVEPADTLCAQCHAPAEMAAVGAHRGKGDTGCTTCHDPHQSGDKFLLKPRTPAAATSAAAGAPGASAAWLPVLSTNQASPGPAKGKAPIKSDLPGT